MRSILHFVLYGNIWIALAALTMAWQSQLIFTYNFEWNELNAFIFFSTMALYAAHRLIGQNKTIDFRQSGRFKIITENQFTISIITFIASIGACYYFLQLSYSLWFLLSPAILLSLAYILPFAKGRRLRDFPFVKIFLVATNWSWITVAMPFFYYSQTDHLLLVTMLLERTFFIFAITLPFDIRDLHFDQHHGVSTIPSRYGIKRTQQFAILTLALAAGSTVYSYTNGGYSIYHLFGVLFSFLLTVPLLKCSNPNRPDYYYTGYIDGSMIFQFVIVYFSTLL